MILKSKGLLDFVYKICEIGAFYKPYTYIIYIVLKDNNICLIYKSKKIITRFTFRLGFFLDFFTFLM